MIALADVKPDRPYIVKVFCGDCGGMLLESGELTGADLKESWSNLVLTKGFNTPRCKQENCRPTYSDFNINSEMRIENAGQSHTDGR